MATKTINQFDQIQNQDITDADFYLIWDNETGMTLKISNLQLKQYVGTGAATVTNFNPLNVLLDRSYDYNDYTQAGALSMTKAATGIFSPFSTSRVKFISDGSGVTWSSDFISNSSFNTADINTMTTAGTYHIFLYWSTALNKIVVSFADESPGVVAPTGFTVTVINATQNDLAWTDANGGSAAYEIQRSISGQASFSVIATTANGATSYSDSTVVSGLAYDYRVRATDGVNFSAFTSEVASFTLTPVTFTNLSSNVSATGNDLTKDSGTAAWNAGAYGSVKAAANSYCQIIMQTVTISEGRIFGFTTTDASYNFTDDEYCASFGDNNLIGVFNSGVSAGLPLTGYSANDYFRIMRDVDGTITYATSTDKISWSTYYTEPATDTSEFFFNFLILTVGGTISNCEYFTTASP